MKYTLEQLIATKLPGLCRDYMYDPYTERVVRLVCEEAGGVEVHYPSEFEFLPQEDWAHLPGCLCLDCTR